MALCGAIVCCALQLGLQGLDEGEPDHALFADLFEVMETTGADFTNTFRLMSRVEPTGAKDTAVSAVVMDPVLELLLDQAATVSELARSRRPRYARRQLEVLRQLQQSDPATFAMLMRAGGVPDDGDHDHDPVKAGAALVERQLKRWEEYDQMLQPSPEAQREANRLSWQPWLERDRARIARELAASGGGSAQARAEAMNRTNPKYVPRNHLAQRAIADAERGDMTEVRPHL